MNNGWYTETYEEEKMKKIIFLLTFQLNCGSIFSW